MTAKELAGILEVPEGTVRGRIRRSKQLVEGKLREISESDAPVKSTLSGLETWARSLREQVAAARGSADEDA